MISRMINAWRACLVNGAIDLVCGEVPPSARRAQAIFNRTKATVVQSHGVSAPPEVLKFQEILETGGVLSLPLDAASKFGLLPPRDPAQMRASRLD